MTIPRTLDKGEIASVVMQIKGGYEPNKAGDMILQKSEVTHGIAKFQRFEKTGIIVIAIIDKKGERVNMVDISNASEILTYLKVK